MTALWLLGGGGHARSCIDVIESTANLTVAGIIEAVGADGGSVLGYPVRGDDTSLAGLLALSNSALVTVGQVTTATLRRELFLRAHELGANFPIVVSSRAYVSVHATIGPGSIVMHGAVVNALATVGVNCIINSQALIEHDAAIGDHCHVSTGAMINGGAVVEDNCFVGSAAVVGHGVRIGKGSVVGAGTVVLRDVSPNTTLRG